MMKIFYMRFNYGVFNSTSDNSCIASIAFQKGLKKEYLTFSSTKSYGTRHNLLWS